MKVRVWGRMSVKDEERNYIKGRKEMRSWKGAL